MRRLTQMVVISIGLSVLNLGLLSWQIVPTSLEWRGFYIAPYNPATLERDIQWWPISTGNRSSPSPRWTPIPDRNWDAQEVERGINDLQDENYRLRQQLEDLAQKVERPVFPRFIP